MDSLNFRHWAVFFGFLVIYSFNVQNTGAHAAASLRNITIGDQDSSIHYSPPGAWSKTKSNRLDSGGSHMLTEKSYGTASFNFTGVAIYFMSPLWPYTVNTEISLDSGPSTLVDLVDYSRPRTNGGPETVQSRVVWKATGLANTKHHLRISVGVNQSYAVVDGLIYSEVTDVRSSSSSSILSTSTFLSSIIPSSTSILFNSTSPSANASPSSKSITNFKSTSPTLVTEIAVPVTVGLLIGIVLTVYFVRRRSRSALHSRLPRRPNWTIEGSYTSLALPELQVEHHGGRDQAVDLTSPSSRLMQPGLESTYFLTPETMSFELSARD